MRAPSPQVSAPGRRSGIDRREAEPALVRSSIAALGAAAFGLFVVWSVGYVPANMDEFNQAHALACLYPQSHLNTRSAFLEGCDAYLLDFGVFSYFRSYQYVGITSSLLYFPLWSVWRSPLSYYLLGLLFLLAFSLAVVKALGLGWKYALIPLCYFPIAYSFIHDTGPVRLSLLSFPVIVLLLKRLLDDPAVSHKLAYAVACATLMTLCVEDKPFYVYLLPTLALFAGASLAQAKPGGELVAEVATRANRLPLLALAVVFLGGVGLLLFAGRTEGRTYFEYLSTAATELPRARVAKRIVSFTLSFPMFGHRVFEVDQPVRIASAAATAAFAAWIAFAAWRDRAVRPAPLVLFALSYIAGVVVFLVTRTTYHGHHYVFLHVPALGLLLLVARANASRFALVLGSVVVFNLGSVALLGATSIEPRSAPERAEIFRYLSRPDVARSNIVNFSSWGGYYQQALYGHDSQVVTWSRDRRRGRAAAAELHRLARQTSRKIINVCMRCDSASVQTLYETANVVEINPGRRHWRVFQIDPDRRRGGDASPPLAARAAASPPP
jgi:hypothetical protein